MIIIVLYKQFYYINNKMNISLYIYTNCSFHNSLGINLIKTSFNSFNKVFDINNFKERIFFLDKNPNI